MDTKHTVWTNTYDKFVALEASLLTTSCHHFNQHTVPIFHPSKGKQEFSVIDLSGSLMYAQKGSPVQRYWKILVLHHILFGKQANKNSFPIHQGLGMINFGVPSIWYQTQQEESRKVQMTVLLCECYQSDWSHTSEEQTKSSVLVFYLLHLSRKYWSQVSLKLVGS